MESVADIAGILTILAGVGAVIFLFRYVQAQNAAGQLSAKNEVIHTWEQNHDANEHRIGALEDTVETLKTDLTEAYSEIKVLREQLRHVEKYAAPEAVARFEKQQEVMIQILKAIQKQLSS